MSWGKQKKPWGCTHRMPKKPRESTGCFPCRAVSTQKGDEWEGPGAWSQLTFLKLWLCHWLLMCPWEVTASWSLRHLISKIMIICTWKWPQGFTADALETLSKKWRLSCCHYSFPLWEHMQGSEAHTLQNAQSPGSRGGRCAWGCAEGFSPTPVTRGLPEIHGDMLSEARKKAGLLYNYGFEALENKGDPKVS